MFNLITKRNGQDFTSNSLIRTIEEMLREPSTRDWFPCSPNLIKTVKQTSALPTDIYREENNIIAKTEIAGVSKDDIEISFEDNNLTISATKKSEIKDEKDSYREIKYGKLTRSFYINENVDFENSKASIKDGILTISLPIVPEVSKKKIIKLIDEPIV